MLSQPCGGNLRQGRVGRFQMAVQSPQTLNAEFAESGVDNARKLFAGRCRLRIAARHSQNRGSNQQRLRVIRTHGERAIQRGERGREFVTALLQGRLQHQHFGHGGILHHPGSERGLCISQVAQIAAAAGLLDIELRQGNGHIDPFLRPSAAPTHRRGAFRPATRRAPRHRCAGKCAAAPAAPTQARFSNAAAMWAGNRPRRRRGRPVPPLMWHSH